MKELEQGVRCVLSIGAVFSCSSLLPRPIEQYRKKYPQVSYKILEGDHYYLGEQLETHAIDHVFARRPSEALTDPKQIAIMPLASVPFVVLVPTNWKLFELKSCFQLGEVAHSPF